MTIKYRIEHGFIARPPLGRRGTVEGDPFAEAIRRVAGTVQPLEEGWRGRAVPGLSGSERAKARMGIEEHFGERGLEEPGFLWHLDLDFRVHGQEIAKTARMIAVAVGDDDRVLNRLDQGGLARSPREAATPTGRDRHPSKKTGFLENGATLKKLC